MGQTSRYQRYVAEMLFMIASGKHIDPDQTTRFRDIVKEIYRNPFEKKKPEPQTADEIYTYLVQKMEELIDGSAAPGREN